MLSNFRTVALGILSGRLKPLERVDDGKLGFRVFADRVDRLGNVILCQSDSGAYLGCFVIGSPDAAALPTREELVQALFEHPNAHALGRFLGGSLGSRLRRLPEREVYERLGRVLGALQGEEPLCEECVEFAREDLPQEVLDIFSNIRGFAQGGDPVRNICGFAQACEAAHDTHASRKMRHDELFLLLAEFLGKYPDLRWNMLLEITDAQRIEILRHVQVPEALMLNWFNRRRDAYCLLFIPNGPSPEERDDILEDARVFLPVRNQEATLIKPLPAGAPFARVWYREVSWVLRAIAENPSAGSFHWIRDASP
jgi:hypothetical protein